MPKCLELGLSFLHDPRILPNYANTDCWKHYEPGTILGKGTFGTTYLATKKGTTEKYAVKVRSWPSKAMLRFSDLCF